MNVYVVTYYDMSDTVVTCFNNKENAYKCYQYFSDKYKNVTIDKCEVYTNFIIKETTK